MAQDRVEPREVSPTERMPWLNIFQGFRIALDFNKLLLAAGGIVVMALGWWFLAVLFNTSEPEWDQRKYEARAGDVENKKKKAWELFREDHERWALRYSAAGNPADRATRTAADVARDADEYRLLKYFERGKQPDPSKMEKDIAAELKEAQKREDFNEKIRQMQELRPAGKLRGWPWF